MKIVFGAAGVEGLGNIPIDEQFGRLENGCQFTDTVTQMAGSPSPVSEDSCLESSLQRDATYFILKTSTPVGKLLDEMGM